jgi:hypothetical protein
VLEIDDAGDLLLDCGDVVVQRVVVEEVALLRPAAGIADHPGRAAGEGEGDVTCGLEPPEHDQADQVPVVQAVGGRIAAVVHRDWVTPRRQAGGQRRAVGRVLDETAGLEVGEYIHRRASMLAPDRGSSTGSFDAPLVTVPT